MNLTERFPNAVRKLAGERRKEIVIDHIPDNKQFWKQLRKDFALLVGIGIISGAGIAVTLYWSVKYNW